MISGYWTSGCEVNVVPSVSDFTENSMQDSSMEPVTVWGSENHTMPGPRKQTSYGITSLHLGEVSLIERKSSIGMASYYHVSKGSIVRYLEVSQEAQESLAQETAPMNQS